MINFDKNFNKESGDYLLFELPTELHEELKTNKFLNIRSENIMTDAFIIGEKGTYQLKKNDISNSLAICEVANKDSQDSSCSSNTFNIKSLKQYKFLAEKVSPPKKQLIEYLIKNRITKIQSTSEMSSELNDQSLSFEKIKSQFCLCDFEVNNIITKMGGVAVYPTKPDKIWNYSEELK